MGRRTSYLLGTITLFFSTIYYLYLWQIQGPFWQWALASVLLGLGFTFFSGATEAWLVDALNFTKYDKLLETAFAKGQIASGIAMLSGTVAGGVIAQATNLGVPYIIRTVILGIAFVVTFILMKDIGFKPRKGASPLNDVKHVLSSAAKHGFRRPAVRWIMLAGPFGAGVGYYGFYAMQPYLLELYGSSGSYAIAGLAAAIVAGAQVAGGFAVPLFSRLSKSRTTLLIVTALMSAATLAFIGLIPQFWVVLGLLVVWGILFAISTPVRQAYLNKHIPSSERATVLSSDNLVSSAGAAGIQPLLSQKCRYVWLCHLIHRQCSY